MKLVLVGGPLENRKGSYHHTCGYNRVTICTGEKQLRGRDHGRDKVRDPVTKRNLSVTYEYSYC